MTPPFTWDLPPDILQLRDLRLGWSTSSPEGATATATTRLQEFETAVLLSRLEGKAGRPGFVVGLKPVEWSLTKAFPALDHPALEQLTFDRVALVLADQEVRAASTDLGEDARDFYAAVYRADQYDLVLLPGANLIAAFPVERLGQNHLLNQIFARLGIDAGNVLIQGTLGRSYASLDHGGGGPDAIKDLYLRASLPKMRPPESPAWLESGLLALEVTGQPSVGFAGEIVVDVEGDVLTFVVKAKIEKDGRGAAVALVGGLQADEPWVHPLDLEWLTLEHLIIKVSVDLKANIGLGFAGKMIVGEKDIDVAIAIKVNASGAITNFLLDGASAAGVSMADLVALQAKMGKPPRGAIPLDRLPPMEIRDIHLKFVLHDDPDLEVTRGFAVKGELDVQMQPQGGMTNVGGVDFSLDDNGIVGRAHLAGCSIGSVSWDDPLLDLELTLARQSLTISGQVDLGFARQHIDVSVTRSGAFFHTDATLAGRFQARLSAEAPFTAPDPVWTVTGEMGNDFNGELANLVAGRLRAWAADSERALAAARGAAEAARQRAEEAAARLAELEASLSRRQAEAKAAMESAERSRDAARKAEARAESTLGKAERELGATPARPLKARAERTAAVAKARADLAARKAAVAAKEAEYAARKAIYDGLTSEAVGNARAAANEAEAAVRAAADHERDMKAMAAELGAGGGTPVVVDHAAFHGQLDRVHAGTVLELDLRFLDRPRHLTVRCDLQRIDSAADELFTALVAGN